MNAFNFITGNEKNTTLDRLYLTIYFIFPLLFLSSFLLNSALFVITIYFVYFIFKNNYFSWINNIFVKILVLFWIYILLNSLINFNSYLEIFKSFSYLRFIILFISIVFILPILKIKFENLFLIYLIFSLIFSFDVIIQFIFGKNIFGFPCQMTYEFMGKIYCQRNSSFFQDELVAGTFILHFGIFGLTYFLFKKKEIFIIYFLGFLLIPIFLSGDRTPFAMSIITMFALIIFHKKSRISILKLSPLLIIVLALFFSSGKIYKRYVENIYSIFTTSEISYQSLDFRVKLLERQISFLDDVNDKSTEDVFFIITEETIDSFNRLQIDHILRERHLQYLRNKNIDEILRESELIKKTALVQYDHYKKRLKNIENVYNQRLKEGNLNKWYNGILDSQYGAHYLTAYEIFISNPIFGAGLKSFREVCKDYKDINSMSVASRCSTHPHNQHLEILSELGLIGYTFFLIIILIFFKFFFYREEQPSIIYFIFFSFICSKIFPFLPSGSFFSSMNSTYFWISFSMFFLIKDLKTN